MSIGFVLATALLGIVLILVTAEVMLHKGRKKHQKKEGIMLSEAKVVLDQLHTVFKDTYSGSADMKAATSAIVLHVFQLRQDGVVSTRAIDRAVDKFGKDLKNLT